VKWPVLATTLLKRKFRWWLSRWADWFLNRYLKALIASGFKLPAQGSSVLLSIGGYDAKKDFRVSALMLAKLGFKLYATHNTADYVINTTSNNSVVVTELSNADILKRVADKQISLVINVTERNKMRDPFAEKTSFGYRLRRLAVDLGIPVITDIKAAKMLVTALNLPTVLGSLPSEIVNPSVDCFTKFG
jgi:hypothetical protein